MIEKLYGRSGKKMVTCDNCGDGFEADSEDEAMTRMQDDGWTTRGRKHYCEDCSHD